jgi:hypothetical protein
MGMGHSITARSVWARAVVGIVAFVVAVAGIGALQGAPAGAATLAVDTTVSVDSPGGTATTPAFSTAGPDELLLAFVSGDSPTGGGQTATVTGAGLTWNLVRRTNVQQGTSEIWQASASAKLTNATVSATLGSATTNDLSLTVVAFTGAAGVGASAGASGPNGAPTVSLTTTAPASLVYATGNDWDRPQSHTVGAGQTMVHQWLNTTVGDAYWVQRSTDPVANASAVTVNDTAPTNDRWNLTAVEIVAAAAASSPPSQPTSVTATAGDQVANVSWAAPATGAPILSYTVYSYVGASQVSATPVTGTPPPTSTTISGLANGTTYTFVVTATNSIGESAPSAASAPATPSAQPAAPTIDPSTPAMTPVTNNVTTVRSDNFSPPNASVLYAVFAMESDSGVTGTHVASISNGGTLLNWHLLGAENHVNATVGGYVEVWWAYNATAQSNIAVTATYAQPTKNVAPPVGSMQILVMNGAAPDQSSAAWTPTYDIGAGSAPTGTVTTTRPNSLVFGVVTNWDSAVVPTVPSNQTLTINGRQSVLLNTTDRDSTWVQVQKAGTPAPGPVTMNDTAPAVRYHMISWEVMAPAPPGTPQLSNILGTSTGTTSAQISWASDLPSTSQVRYGPTTAYGATTTLDPALVTSHGQNITGLTAGTQYHFQVVSSGASGGTATSGDFTVTTSGGTAAGVGQWGSTSNWPLVAVHSTLMPNGKVLMWDGWQTPTPTQVWDPANNTFQQITTGSGLFCAGQVQLPDGRIFVAGGHDQGTGFTETGIKDANIFNPATNTWTRVADMHYDRWYPAVTALPDGRVLVVSGNTTPGHWADTPEVYDPATNTWTLLTNVNTSQVHEVEYPVAFVLPNGKVVVIAPSTGEARVLDVGTQSWTSVGFAGFVNGSVAQFAPGKYLLTGGGNTSSTTNPAV